MSSGEKVRLLQIDTPELSSKECYGDQARAELVKLLSKSNNVKLVSDLKLDKTDSYGRSLRYVFVHENALFKARIDMMANPVSKAANDKGSAAWSGFRKFRVAKKIMEKGDCCSFYLEPHDGRELPAFLPGQYLTFKLKVPGQPKEVTRCYSLSDSPNPQYYRVTIKRVPPPPKSPELPPGVSSNHFNSNVNEGDILDVKAPSGNFHIDVEAQSPVVLIGGGRKQCK